MPSTTSLERIKDLLADGQTEAATDLLLELAKTAHQEYFHSALLLKNRLETLQHNVIEGVISPGEERIEWARISKGVVGLVEQIDRREAPKPTEALMPPKPSESRAKGFSMKILWVVPVLVLLGVAVPKFLAKRTVPATEKTQKTLMTEYQGQVVRADGRSAPNVKLVFSKDEFKREVVADGQGRYSIKLPEKFKVVAVEIYFNDQLLLAENIPVIEERLRRLKIPN